MAADLGIQKGKMKNLHSNLGVFFQVEFSLQNVFALTGN